MNNNDNLGTPSEHEFMKFYDQLGKPPPLTFRFFDYKDFVTTHEDSAEFVADQILKSRAKLRWLGRNKIPSLTINSNTFHIALKELLLVYGYRVEIYGKVDRTWSLKTKASPGNLGSLEDFIYNSETSHSRGLLALKLTSSKNGFGLAYVDPADRVMQVVEFEDNEFLTTLESLIVRLGPIECIFPSTFQAEPSYERFQNMLKLNSVMLTAVKPQNFSVPDFEITNLRRLISKRSPVSVDTIVDYKVAFCSLLAALQYLNVFGDDQNNGQYSLRQLLLESMVLLDSSAITSLSLFPSKGSPKLSSVYGLLNKCKTSGGQRLLGQYIRQPLTDVKKINERLEIVDFFLRNTNIRDRIHESIIRGVPDLARLSKKFHNRKASLGDCVRIYTVIESLPQISRLLKEVQNDVIQAAFLDSIYEMETRFEKFKELVTETIDFHSEETAREPVVKASFNEDLEELGVELKKYKEDAKDITRKVCRELGLEFDKNLKMESNGNTGFFLRVTRKEERSLRNCSLKYELVEKAKRDGIRFITPELKRLNVEYLETKKKFDVVHSELVKNIIMAAATYSDYMRTLGATLSYLDVMTSFAVAAGLYGYVRPIVLPIGSGIIKLTNVRHPCVEACINSGYIPNSIEFKDRKTFIITGPNMGGKSTFLRSIGIATLLAQIGSFIPAQDGTITVVDSIFTRVGSQDKQVQGLSTFMVEMMETSSILKSSTSNSLVLIDELGRGTSTYEGFGLAWAIARTLATKIKAFCLFATHFHELTEMAKKVPEVGNLHVTAITSDDKFTLLYEVKDGTCDQSFGVHVAKLAKFSENMIKYTELKVDEMEKLPVGMKDKDELRAAINYGKGRRSQVNTQAMSDDQLLTFLQELKDEVNFKQYI